MSKNQQSGRDSETNIKTNKVPPRPKLTPKAGRPKVKFTPEQINQITQAALDNCHIDTIALALGIAKNTLKRHFGPFINQKRAEGRIELAHAQRVKAIDSKDSTMLIWRGKQDLGQADKQEITGKDGKPIPLSIVDFGKYKSDRT